MSHFTGDDGKKYAIFGEGGVKRTAEEFKKEFLGEIPINPEVGKQGDLGVPIVESKPENIISKIYLELAEKISKITVGAINFLAIACNGSGSIYQPFLVLIRNGNVAVVVTDCILGK